VLQTIEDCHKIKKYYRVVGETALLLGEILERE